MSLTVGELKYTLSADASGLNKQLKDADGRLRGVGETGKKAGKDTADGMDKATASTRALAGEAAKTRGAFDGLGKVAVGAAVVAGIGTMIDAASDLNEAINLNSNVWGENAKAMEEWSQNSATQMGLARDEALMAAASYGNLFQNLGVALDDSTQYSQKLVELSADMASAFNTDVPQALSAIQSGLVGQSEPLRQYGVMLDDVTLKEKARTMGLYDGKGVLSQQAKALATYEIILEKTAKIQGDFVLTSDGVANSQRVLAAQVRDTAAELGASLLPAAQSALSAARDVVTWVNENQELVKTLAIVAAAIYAVNKAGLAYTSMMTRMTAAQMAYNASAVAGAGRMAGMRAMLASSTGGVAAVAAGGAFAGSIYNAGMNVFSDQGRSNRQNFGLDDSFGSDLLVTGANLGQDLASFLSAGALDDLTGKTEAEKDAALKEMAARNQEYRDKQELQAAENKKRLTELQAQGLITSKEAQETITKDAFAEAEARERAAEAAAKRQQSLFDSMQLMQGAPDMFDTKTVGKGKNQREIQVEKALDPDALLKQTKEGAAYQKALTADLEKLKKSGATQDTLTQLMDIEASNPGTIAKIASGNTEKYVTSLNKSLATGAKAAKGRDQMIQAADDIWKWIADAPVRAAERDWAAYTKALGKGKAPGYVPMGAPKPGTGNTWNTGVVNVVSDNPEHFMTAAQKAAARNRMRGRG